MAAQPSSSIEIHVRLTTGLYCDSAVLATCAEQPSSKDILLGRMPGLPKIHRYKPSIAAKLCPKNS